MSGYWLRVENVLLDIVRISDMSGQELETAGWHRKGL
jgi:hypothetical protein